MLMPPPLLLLPPGGRAKEWPHARLDPVSINPIPTLMGVLTTVYDGPQITRLMQLSNAGGKLLRQRATRQWQTLRKMAGQSSDILWMNLADRFR